MKEIIDCDIYMESLGGFERRKFIDFDSNKYFSYLQTIYLSKVILLL